MPVLAIELHQSKAASLAFIAILQSGSLLMAQESPYVVTYDHHLEEPENRQARSFLRGIVLRATALLPPAAAEDRACGMTPYGTQRPARYSLS